MKAVSSRLNLLDAGRGIAALMIVFHHAYGHLMDKYLYQPWSVSDAGQKIKTILYYLFWIPDHINHEAVLFFFILSGFCIHYQAARLLSAGELQVIHPLKFYFKRLARIIPPLLVALLITYFCDSWSEGLLQNVDAQMPHSNQMASAVEGAYTDKSAFFGNLSLLMPFFVKPYGTNWPLWALGYEAWYYVFYPVWFWMTRSFGGIVAFTVSMSVALLSVIFIHGHGFSLYPVLSTWWLWCLGAILAEVHAGRYKLRWLNTIPIWLLGLGIFLILFVLSTFPPKHSLISYALWGPILGVLVFKCGSSKVNKVTSGFSFIGRFSYSLYIIHMPILILLSAFWLRYYGPLPHFPWLVFSGIICAVIAGWAIALLVEHPLERLRANAGL